MSNEIRGYCGRSDDNTNTIKLPNGNTVVPGSWVRSIHGVRVWLCGLSNTAKYVVIIADPRGVPMHCAADSITGPWVEPTKPNPLPKLLDGAMPPRGRFLYWNSGISFMSHVEPEQKDDGGFVSALPGVSVSFPFVDWTGIPPEQRCVETDRFHAQTRYDWSKAPEWAEWAATDECGLVLWYSCRPGTAKRESLERRPGK